MGMSDALAQDFDWLVTCAKINASLGYPVGELFKSNSTARDLMEISSCRIRNITDGEDDYPRRSNRPVHLRRRERLRPRVHTSLSRRGAAQGVCPFLNRPLPHPSGLLREPGRAQ